MDAKWTRCLENRRMGQLHFTDKTIKSLKTTKAQEYFWDRTFQLPGFQFGIHCYRSGVKVWVIRYRAPGGRRPEVSLGNVVAMSLSKARDEARARLAAIQQGKDPAKMRDDYHAADTFDDLCKKFLEDFDAKVANGLRRASTRSHYADGIRLYFQPAWRTRKVCDISRRDVIALVDEINNVKKHPAQAQRVRAMASRMFNFALEREIIDKSPCIGLPKIDHPKPRTRFLDEEELQKVWQACEECSPTIAGIFRLLILTGQRCGEVTGMRWDEIKGQQWILPGNRTKNHREHIVPLSLEALRIVEGMKSINRRLMLRSRKWGDGAKDYYMEFVFPSRRQGKSVKWLAKKCCKLAELAGVPHFSPHDLRRTASTHIRKLGISRDVVKMILNHAPQDVTGIHYDHYQALTEKQQALESWSAEVRRVIQSSERCKVHNLR